MPATEPKQVDTPKALASIMREPTVHFFLLAGLIFLAYGKGVAAFTDSPFQSIHYEPQVISCLEGDYCRDEAVKNNYYRVTVNVNRLAAILKRAGHYPFNN